MNVQLTDPADEDLAQRLLLESLMGIVDRVRQRGIEAVAITKRPIHEGCTSGVEHWAIELTLKALPIGSMPSTYVEGDGKSKPS